MTEDQKSLARTLYAMGQKMIDPIGGDIASDCQRRCLDSILCGLLGVIIGKDEDHTFEQYEDARKNRATYLIETEDN